MDQSDAGTGTSEKSGLSVEQSTSGECRRLVSSPTAFRQYGAEESPHRKLIGNSIAMSFCNEPEIFGLERAILCWTVARSRPWPPRTFVAFFALSVSFAAESGRLRSSIFWKRRYNRKRRHQVFRGGVTASTEMLAARRHTGAHSPVSGAKTIIANSNQFAYAA
jgi:hypothetical protein